jgi:hypothetical protein
MSNSLQGYLGRRKERWAEGEETEEVVNLCSSQPAQDVVLAVVPPGPFVSLQPHGELTSHVMTSPYNTLFGA